MTENLVTAVLQANTEKSVVLIRTHISINEIGCLDLTSTLTRL